MRLIPLEHPIPPGIEHERFRLRILTVDDLLKDYEAVMSSAVRLRERFPYWGWPDPGMTIKDDLIDLGWHQKEAMLRRSFNYAVMTPDESRLLGCVYVDPPEDGGVPGKVVAEVSWWVVAEAPAHVADAVLAFVPTWLERAWPFEEVRYPFGEIPT